MNIEISKINVLPIDGKANCVAIVQLELASCIRCSGIKLFYSESNGKHWVKYPKNTANRHGAAFVYPCTPEATADLEKAIWDAYLEATKA